VIPLRDANPTRRVPVVTIGLIVACFVAFGWQLGLLVRGGQPALDAFFLDHGVVPAELTAALGRGGFLSEPLLDLVTSQFLHVGWLHLLANLAYLWIFGNNVEDRLGRAAFLGFYLVGGIVAAAVQVAVEPGSAIPLVGASGAIAATLGAYLVLFPRARILSLAFLVFFYQLVEVPAVIVLGFWFVLQLIDGVASLGATAEGGVAFFAHIGGFVAGLLVGFVLRARRPRSLRPARVG
jgi:membrane associated rhomboid family serine protease